MKDFARSIIETIRPPLVVLDAGLKVVVANPSFYRTVGLGVPVVEGDDFFAIV